MRTQHSRRLPQEAHRSVWLAMTAKRNSRAKRARTHKVMMCHAVTDTSDDQRAKRPSEWRLVSNGYLREPSIRHEHLHRRGVRKSHESPTSGDGAGLHIRCKRVPAWQQLGPEAPLCVGLNPGDVTPGGVAHGDGRLIRISRALASGRISVITALQDRSTSNTGRREGRETGNPKRLTKNRGRDDESETKKGEHLNFHGNSFYSTDLKYECSNGRSAKPRSFSDGGDGENSKVLFESD